MDQENPRDKNPLLEPWTGPFEIPPFDQLKPEQFRHAFEVALGAARGEIQSIANNPEPPTFENTIEALEQSGRDIDPRCVGVSSISRPPTPMTSSKRSSAKIDACARAPSQRTLSQRGAVSADRCAAGAEGHELDLDAEQLRVLDRYHIAFLRNGGGLPDATKARLAEINERFATLGTQVRAKCSRR